MQTSVRGKRKIVYGIWVTPAGTDSQLVLNIHLINWDSKDHPRPMHSVLKEVSRYSVERHSAFTKSADVIVGCNFSYVINWVLAAWSSDCVGYAPPKEEKKHIIPTSKTE